MGTNYYWRYNLCACCGRYDEAHVCKSGHTWQAYRNELLNDQHPEWGYSVESPFGRPIESVADWRKVFVDFPGELWDEYGEKIEDPGAWVEEWGPPTAEAWAAKRRYWRPESDSKDAEGYHLMTGDFS